MVTATVQLIKNFIKDRFTLKFKKERCQRRYGRVNYCIIVCGIGYDILMNKPWIVSRTTTPAKKKKKKKCTGR